MTIGQKVCKVRELCGYSQEYMGLRLGISQTAYSKIERSAGYIAPARLSFIAEILGVEVSFLLDFDVDSIFRKNHENQRGMDTLERQFYESKIQALQNEIYFLRNPPPYNVTFIGN